MRTDGSRGTYEWWYFDAHLDDGAKLVMASTTSEAGGRPDEELLTALVAYHEELAEAAP